MQNYRLRRLKVFLFLFMPTFFEVYQDYLKDPRSVRLGKKQYKKLHHTIHYHYDKWYFKTPLEYKEVQESGETFNVRIYPDKFIPRMKMVIIQVSEKYKANVANDLAVKEKSNLAKKSVEKPVSEPRKEEPPKSKKRTRKPIPAFSLKK